MDDLSPPRVSENEAVYDAAGEAPLSPQRDLAPEGAGETCDAGGGGCHAPGEMAAAAAEAGKADVLEQFAADYPMGPHDKPQSMCPAFGSLRVGLRMKRTATILSGSACCVYGLTFTSHFYGAK
ncbi:MAG: chlorophyllide reductase subunit Y, partial [Pseudomonadota bacterium]